MASQNIQSYLRTLGRNPQLEDLFIQADQLNKVAHAIIESAIIPAHLIEHCKLGPLSHTRLTVLAENASVAAKLKHISPSLLLQLQKLGWEITAIKILVQKPADTRYSSTHHGKPPVPRKPAISPTGIESLKRLAGSLSDSELKNSIQQLLTKHS